MDSLAKKIAYYKSLAREIVDYVGTVGVKPDDPVKHQIIKDEERGHYLIFFNGWEDDARYYGCYLHIDVSDDGKIWLQHDGTDWEIGQRILDKGVPKKDMVIGFHAPFMRPDTEFAVG